MARSLLDLANSLDSKVKKLEKNTNQMTIEAADLVVQRLVFITPVDTSQALSNWLVGIKSRAEGPVSARVEGSNGSTRQISGRITLAEARSKLKRRKLGETIYITNHLDYVADLNRGSSKQAPVGFVENAAKAANLTVKIMKKDLLK